LRQFLILHPDTPWRMREELTAAGGFAQLSAATRQLVKDFVLGVDNPNIAKIAAMTGLVDRKAVHNWRFEMPAGVV